MALKVTTNNVPRLMLDFSELSEAERAQFDYIGEDGEGAFIRYRGWTYDLGEFLRGPSDVGLAGWDGYSSDSFFSGVVVKFCPDDSEPHSNGHVHELEHLARFSEVGEARGYRYPSALSGRI